MKKEEKERIDQRKTVDLIRSIMKLYLQKSGKYPTEEINKRVDENIKRVILKPRDNDYLGEASIDESEITIYGVDSIAPTFEEILWNLDYYKPTMLHEGEHKFFTHKSENGTVTGSALLRLISRNKEFKEWLKRDIEHIDMKQIEEFVPNAKELKKRKIKRIVLDSEIGRGISEGFIEWYRVEVLGNKSDVTYENITSVIYKLQKYLDEKGEDGTSVIAEYGDSDYDYVFDTLNMSKSTGVAFIRILDAMYYLLEKKKVDRIDDIIRYFELEEANTLQPDFLSRYRERIKSLDIFGRLQEEYQKIPYRKETFKEFVSRKNEDRRRALSKYERLVNDFLARALEKREDSQGMLELSDISDLIDEVVVLTAQNKDDIAEGMRISFEKHNPEVKEKPKAADKKKEDNERIKTVLVPVKVENPEEVTETEEGKPTDTVEKEDEKATEVDGGTVEESELQNEETTVEETELSGEGTIAEGQNSKVSMPQFSIIDGIAFDAKCAIEDIAFGAKCVAEDLRFNAKCAMEDISFNIDYIKQDLAIKKEFRKIKRATKKEERRYFDNSGKLAFIALAAAIGISATALTAYLIGEIRNNLQTLPNVEITEPQGSDPIHTPEIPIEVEIPEKPPVETEQPKEDIFPFLNEDGTISLKAGSTIYRSSDKVGGKTTLKYDYDNLIIDYIRLMQNNNQVLNAGDLSNLQEFIDSLGEDGLSIMMRLGVEQNGEKVYIAWCDYAEMLENAKNIEDIEKTEDMDR